MRPGQVRDASSRTLRRADEQHGPACVGRSGMAQEARRGHRSLLSAPADGSRDGSGCHGPRASPEVRNGFVSARVVECMWTVPLLGLEGAWLPQDEVARDRCQTFAHRASGWQLVFASGALLPAASHRQATGARFPDRPYGVSALLSACRHSTARAARRALALRWSAWSAVELILKVVDLPT